MAKPPGRLEVIATPIGNLRDLSERARNSLAEADLIAAEDTRHTQILLQSIGVSRPMVSLHAYNESRRLHELIARLHAGERIALVSDAGTPLLSDPGFELVRRAAEEGIEISAIPGPSAVTAALAVSGLPTDRFCFEGFLPSGASERRARLEQLASEPRTLVFFEAPHRIAASLVDFATIFGGERRAAVARELTKAHETVYRGTLAELAERAREDANFKRGEITLVVEGQSQSHAPDTQMLRKVVALLVRELPPGKAASIAAQLCGVKRNEAYQLAMQMAKESDATDADERSE